MAWLRTIFSRFRITSKAIRFRAALVQLHPASSALRGLSRCASETGFDLAHVTPIKADKNEEKTMTNIDFTLLIDALARLVAALATFVIAFRRRRR